MATSVEIIQRLSLAFSARRRSGEKGRLSIAAGYSPLGRRTAIVFQLEQGELPRLGALPCLKLLAPQSAEALPAKGMTVDDDNFRLCRDTLPLRPRRPERERLPAMKASASRSGNPSRAARGRRQ